MNFAVPVVGCFCPLLERSPRWMLWWLDLIYVLEIPVECFDSLSSWCMFSVKLYTASPWRGAVCRRGVLGWTLFFFFFFCGWRTSKGLETSVKSCFAKAKSYFNMSYSYSELVGWEHCLICAACVWGLSALGMVHHDRWWSPQVILLECPPIHSLLPCYPPVGYHGHRN